MYGNTGSKSRLGDRVSIRGYQKSSSNSRQNSARKWNLSARRTISLRPVNAPFERGTGCICLKLDKNTTIARAALDNVDHQNPLQMLTAEVESLQVDVITKFLFSVASCIA